MGTKLIYKFASPVVPMLLTQQGYYEDDQPYIADSFL